MPIYARVLISIAAACAAVAVAYWQAGTGNQGAAVAAGLAGFIGVVGVWIFPEASAAKQIRRR